MTFKLKCREASKLLSEAADRRLGFALRVKLRVHLSICDACTNFSKQLAFMRKALAAYPGPDGDEDRPG